MSVRSSWQKEMLKEAQNSPCYGDNENPKDGVVMFRHYYTVEDETGHIPHAVSLEHKDRLNQEIDKEATVEKAKRIFINKTPDNVNLVKTELAEQGVTNHPERNNQL